MTPLSRPRRIGLATVALATAFALFHAQLAAAVVTRGDDALRAGDVEGALRFYDRATKLDPASAVAADRLAFHLAFGRSRDGARRSIEVASHALEAGVLDPALLADRAFAELALRRWREAERDFARAGTLAHDARYDHFAARMALRSADRVSARRYARRALADAPDFTPARTLLRSLR